MDLHADAESYIQGSIEASLGLPVPESTMRMKLLASEDERRHLQDQVFVLHGRLRDAERRLELYREEASMNAKGIRRCVEEKEALESTHSNLVAHCAKLETECNLYERDLEKIMETCDELGRENEELRAGQRDNSTIFSLVAEVESLKKDKEHLRINLCTAEEEVKVLFEENRNLYEENRKLLRLQRGPPEGGLNSSDTSAMGKRKSRLKDRGCGPAVGGQAIDFHDMAGSPRQPLSPVQQYRNSPESRMHKKPSGVAD